LNESLEDAQKLQVEMQHRYDTQLAWYQDGTEPDYWYVDQAQQNLDDANLALQRIRQQGNAQLQDASGESLRAELARQEAEDQLAELQRGPDPQEVEAARLEIEAAELALEDARADLERAVLRAPFAGIATQVNVHPGERAETDSVVISLAALDELQARTVDLTELDVARLHEARRPA